MLLGSHKSQGFSDDCSPGSIAITIITFSNFIIFIYTTVNQPQRLLLVVYDLV